MRILFGLLIFCVAVSTPACAQDFPSKQVTLIVPFAPGGSSDIMARAIGQRLSELWKQPVIIDNRPGGTTTTGTAYAAVQPADGYTILLAPPPFVIMQHVYSNLKYSAMNDFRAVTVIAYYPLVTVVHPSVPANNLKELIEFARAKPGTPYPSPGPGTTVHLITEYMAREEKIDLVHVPYRSGGQGINDLIGGRLTFYSGPTTEILQQVRAGNLRAIAVLADKRTQQLPNVSTSGEQGFGKYVATSWSALMVPAKTPDAIVAKINADVKKVIAEPQFRTKLEEQGAEFVGSTPAEAQAFLVKEDNLWGPLVKAIGIKPEN